MVNSQYIHFIVEPRVGGGRFACTFIYGFNDCNGRIELWTGLKAIAKDNVLPWILMGDFNAVSSYEDRIGAPVRESETRSLVDCMQACQLTDVKTTGRYYIWCNKQDGNQRVYSQIDRALANPKWFEVYDLSEVHIMPEGDFGHTPLLMCVYPECQLKKPFRFQNMWCLHEKVLEVIRREWCRSLQGCDMYKVCKKLKMVKNALKSLNKDGIGDVEANVVKARGNLLRVQIELLLNLTDHALIRAEKQATEELHRANKMLNSFLQQKANCLG